MWCESREVSGIPRKSEEGKWEEVIRKQTDEKTNRMAEKDPDKRTSRKEDHQKRKGKHGDKTG